MVWLDRRALTRGETSTIVRIMEASIVLHKVMSTLTNKGNNAAKPDKRFV